MPMLLGSKGSDIMQWRASVELVERLRERLDRKWARSTAREAESFLGAVIASVEEELSYESQLDEELSSLHRSIREAESPLQLQPIRGRYHEVVTAHFRRRSSVLALCGACCSLHDALLARAIELAEERMLQLGQGRAPIYALLVSGDRGREEETLHGNNRYLLLHELDSPRFFLFSRQLLLSFREAGLLAGEEMLWHGSLLEWRALLADGREPREAAGGAFLAPVTPFDIAPRPEPQPIQDWKWRLEAMADLRFLTGYEPLGAQALSAAALCIKEQKNRDPFMQVARRVITLPLALGRFGRWRLVRSGEHKGEIDLEELALLPMMMTLRAMAVQAGVHGGGSVQRVRALLERGALDVDLADRLLKAFQCFMQLRIESEIRTEQGGAFANPEEFSLERDQRIREAVEAVLSLQKIAYQKMVGQL
ncbi:MAG TPA: nucleotidyltransferase [Geobacter sp.]|nr:nucleotidyltransferase [Geobacter sp.]